MTEPTLTDHLVSRAAAGDLAAAYDVLGRQVSVDDWRRVLERFAVLAEAGQEIDLELVARRAIRRPVAVAIALLEVCKEVDTAQSLFVVGAIHALRNEEVVQERAAAAAEVLRRLLPDPTVGPERAPSDALEAFYRLLSEPFVDQRERWVSASQDWRSAITVAVRSERDRLRSLTRESSASSGSYLHYLRHKLADLILVIGIGDDLGEWAYRLLQLRTEQLDELGPLLREVPEETRQRFISWVLTPRKDAPVDRIRFLLRLASEEFPADLDIEALEVLASAADPGLAADSLVVAVKLQPENPAVTTLASQGIADLPMDDATRVASVLIREAPDGVKIAAIPGDRADAIAELAGDRGERLAAAITQQLSTLRDTDAALSWVGVLEHLPTTSAAYQEGARQIVRRAIEDPRPEAAARSLESFLQRERFREALWTVLDDVPVSVLPNLVPALLRREDPRRNARYLGGALSQLTGERHAAVRLAALEGLCDGIVDPEDLAAIWPATDRNGTATELRDRITEADAELGRLEGDLTDIESAMRRDLAEAALPVIRDAVATSASNPGTQDVYQRLAAALEPAPTQGGGDPPTAGPLVTSSQHAHGGSDLERLQALLRHDSDPREFLSDADAGDFAQRVLQDLFERGAMFQAAVRLNADTRQSLLTVAMAEGFDPPPAWTDHPALGTWLRQELARRAPAETAGTGGDIDIMALFQVAAKTFGSLHALRREIAEKRGDVSREIAARLTPLFNELNAMVDGYYEVWRTLQLAGWRPVDIIGRRIRPDELDSDRHEILSGQGSSVFIVRRPGVEVDGQVVEMAQLEGVDE